MKFIIGLVLIILFVSLSGCNELVGNNGDSEDTNIAQITSLNIVTEWKVYIGKDELGNNQYDYVETDGFLKKQPENSEVHLITITGIVKNIAGRNLDYISIIANFYDKNDDFLESRSDNISSISNSYSEDFEIFYSGKYKNNCYRVEFDIKGN